MSNKIARDPIDFDFPIIPQGVENRYQVVGIITDNPNGTRNMSIRYIGVGFVRWPQNYRIQDPERRIKEADLFDSLPEGAVHIPYEKRL